MTGQWWGIAATMHERGEGYTRYRAVLRYVWSANEDAAREEFLRLMGAEYEGAWQCISATTMPCPTSPPPHDPEEGVAA